MDQTLETWTIKLEADAGELETQLAGAALAGRQFSRAMATAFEGVALQGKSVGDVVRTLSLSLSRLALNAAFKPLEQMIGGALQNALLGGGLFGGLAFANGGVIDRGVPVPFARGGVISSPVAFPMSGGLTGIAGERGAEAIMPLARGPDGRLGVKADGRGSGMTVNFNIATPDADSFRRTESQLAAMLARAVGQGQRNL